MSTTSYSVQFSPLFHSRSSRDQDALHALQYPASSSSSSSSSYGLSSGSTLRANHSGSIDVEVAGNQRERLNGKMAVSKESDHDCVLIYDEATKTYTLHRLSTTTRLSKSSRSGLAADNPTSTTPTNHHAVSPPITAKNASHLSSAHTVRNLSPSPRPHQSNFSPRPDASIGLGISSASTMDRNSSGRPALGRKGLPQASISSANARSAPVLDVEDFSGSDSDDIVFEMDNGLSLPSQAASASTIGSSASTAPPAAASNRQANAGLGFMNASIVLSDDEDEDDEDEGDFDDLANDLEESLAELEPLPPPMTAPPAASAAQVAPDRATQPMHVQQQAQAQSIQQQSQPAGSAAPAKQWSKSGGVVDSDIASSSESDDDSASD